jgi:uncharacterized membrane protein
MGCEEREIKEKIKNLSNSDLEKMIERVGKYGGARLVEFHEDEDIWINISTVYILEEELKLRENNTSEESPDIEYILESMILTPCAGANKWFAPMSYDDYDKAISDVNKFLENTKGNKANMKVRYRVTKVTREVVHDTE